MGRAAGADIKGKVESAMRNIFRNIAKVFEKQR